MLPQNLSEIWETYDKKPIFVLRHGENMICFVRKASFSPEFLDNLSKVYLYGGGGSPDIRREFGVFIDEIELSYFTIHSEEDLAVLKEKIRLYNIRKETTIEVLL